MFDYNKFLSSKDRRFLNIVEYLVFEKAYITVQEIEKLNRCSNRTVYNDIDELLLRCGNKMNAQFKSNILSINNVSAGNYEEITKRIISASVDIQVIKSIFENPGIDVDQLSYDVGISDSYAYRVLNRIKQQLKQVDIYIQAREYELCSHNEQQLRLFMTELYYQSEFCHEYFKDQDTREKYMSYLEKHFDAKHLLKHDSLNFYLIIYMHISFLREQAGFILGNTKQQLTSEIPDIFKSVYPELKATSFYAVMKSLNVVENCSIIKEINYELLYTQFESSLTNNNFNLKYLDVDATLKSLFDFICLSETRNIKGIKTLTRACSYGKKLKKNKPKLYVRLEKMLRETFDSLNLNTDWEELLHILIFIFMLENPTDINTETKSLLIVSDFSYVHAKSIKNFMEGNFPEHMYDVIKIYELGKANTMLKDRILREYDYIVTTVQLETFSNDKQIVIDDIFNDNDLLKFYNKLYK